MTSINPFTIRGYALPFDYAIDIDGVRESFEAGAFKPTVRNVPLVFDTHDEGLVPWAGTSTGSMSIWADAYGVAFEATLAPMAGVAHRLAAIRSGCLGEVSILFSNFGRRPGNATERRIHTATLEHLSIVPFGAYGEGTGAWVADSDLLDLPPRLRAMARRWEAGRAGATPIAGRMADRFIADRAACRLAYARARNGGAPRPATRRTPVPKSVATLVASPDFARAAALQRQAAAVMMNVGH